jgi:hypothetical protein
MHHAINVIVFFKSWAMENFADQTALWTFIGIMFGHAVLRCVDHLAFISCVVCPLRRLFRSKSNVYKSSHKLDYSLIQRIKHSVYFMRWRQVWYNHFEFCGYIFRAVSLRKVVSLVNLRFLIKNGGIPADGLTGSRTLLHLESTCPNITSFPIVSVAKIT